MIKKLAVVALTGLILATSPAFSTNIKQTVTLEQKIEKKFPSEQIKDIENWRQYADDIFYIVAEKMGYEVDENIPKPTIVTEMTTQEFSRLLGDEEDYFTAVSNCYFDKENKILLTEDSELDSLAHEYVHYFQVQYGHESTENNPGADFLEWKAIWTQRWFEKNYME